MKRTLALLLTVLMAFALLTACGTTPEPGTTDPTTPAATDVPTADGPDPDFNLTACIASEPETIDPTLYSSVDGSTYIMHMFEGLMKYNSTGEKTCDDDSLFNTEIVNGVITGYDVSDDGLTYTFHLKEGLLWSDGVGLKAGDFVYSWRRLVDPATASDYGYILDGIVVNASAIQAGEADVNTLGIEATDDLTLIVKLEAECPYFIPLCSFASLMPLREDIITKYGADWARNPEYMVVNGAYKVSEWVHDSYIKMVPNENYYDYLNLGPGSITWYLNADQTSILAAYQSGDYMFAENVPNEMIPSLMESGDLFAPAYTGTYYLYLNCEKITDWRVRAAINLCIDREFLVTSVTMAGETPAGSFVPPGITDSTNAQWVDADGSVIYRWLGEQYPDYDLTEYSERCDLAVDLMNAAIADGFDVNTTIEYTFNTSDAHRAIATAVQNDVKNVLHLNIQLSNMEWNVYTNGLAEHTFGLARLGWIADYNDPITYLELLTNGNSYNYGLWVSDDYTAAVTSAKSLPGGAERDAYLYQAEYIMFSEGGFPVAPIYYYTNPYCLANGVGNVWYTPFGHFMFIYANMG